MASKSKMNEKDIRQRGMAIDLPFESGFADPQEIEYEATDDPAKQYDPAQFPDHSAAEALAEYEEAEREYRRNGPGAADAPETEE